MAATRLIYDDVGDPDGAPVVYLHGGGDSRLSRHPDDTIATELGVRLLAVDRCGPPDPRRTLVSFARDVLGLLDSLEIERASVVGWSAGGPHALAVAATGGARIERAVVVAGMPPPDGLRAMPEDAQRTIRVARRSTRAGAALLARWSRRPPPPTGTPESDRAYAEGRVESFRHGTHWLALELAALSRPWGFELADVRAPVSLLYGARDVVCPPSIGERYARELPDAVLRVVDETHQLLFSRWREILADAALRTRR